MSNDVSGVSYRTYWSGFESNWHLGRFIAASLAIILPFLTLIYASASTLGLEVGGAKVQIGLKGNATVKDSISQIAFGKGGLQLKTSSGATFATTLVPANQLWVPTGIRVRPGDCVQIQASGSVDLAMNQTLKINEDPSRFLPENQYYFLVDPHGNRLDSGLSGQPRVRRRVADDLRDSLKLAPNVALGALVATVADNGAKVRLDRNPTDAAIFSIFDTDSGFAYSKGPSGELLLSINDLVPNRTKEGREAWLLKRNADGSVLSDKEWYSNIQTAYSISANDVPQEIALLERRWDKASEHYQRYFYEDNSGSFMVAVAIIRPSNGECNS